MISVTPQQRRFASFMTDVLVYVVVLNLFVEFVDSVIIDSFVISIFTAIVLKVLLDLIVASEHAVGAFFARMEHPVARLLRLVAMWLILFLSKFVILEVVDIVFGEHVELGGFFMIVGLVLALMATREIFARIYGALGTEATTAA